MATSPLLDRHVIASVINNRAVWEVWKTWTTTGSTGTTGTNVWPIWTQGTTSSTYQITTTTSTTTEAWYHWTVDGRCIPVTSPVVYEAQPRVVTPEQAAQQAERRRQRDAEVARQRAAEAAAREKAERLLLTLLTPEQEKAWREERAIFVTSQSGKRFKIKEGMAHNFFEVDTQNRLIKEFCAHVSYSAKCPVIDNVIAQMLALRFNEELILKTANVRQLVQEGAG